MRRLSIFAISLFILAIGCKKSDLQVPAPETQNDLAVAGAAGGKSGPSANGQGTLTVGDQTRHFSFHANTASDGTVTGSGVLSYTAGGTQTRFDIDCMTVVGNVATMSGVVMEGDAIPIGFPVWFRVIDNGEGSNATEDRMTLMTYYTNGAPIPCTTPFANTLYNIEGGNIQVKP